MCDTSTAVSIIQRYVDDHLFSPSFTWPKYEFRKRSYQQWAAYEICDRIMDKPFDDPITIIENFMFEMAMYACYGEDEQRTPTSGNNYNFTQNNYSPKALSRIDIYRQTKNQFSALKGLVET